MLKNKLCDLQQTLAKNKKEKAKKKKHSKQRKLFAILLLSLTKEQMISECI